MRVLINFSDFKNEYRGVDRAGCFIKGDCIVPAAEQPVFRDTKKRVEDRMAVVINTRHFYQVRGFAQTDPTEAYEVVHVVDDIMKLVG